MQYNPLSHVETYHYLVRVKQVENYVLFQFLTYIMWLWEILLCGPSALVTSAKDVMCGPLSVCLFVGLFLYLPEGLWKKFIGQGRTHYILE